MTDATMVRPSDLRPSPSHIHGPTWQRTEDGYWHLPERTLGWELIDWLYANVKDPSGEDEDAPFIPTDEQARFILWWYAVDKHGRFSYRNGVLRRLKGWGKDPAVAAISLAELCGPVAFDYFAEEGNPVGKTRPNAWVQVAAVSQDQTRNTFSLFGQMVTEKLKTEWKLEIHKTLIHAKNGRMIEGVTSSPMALEGKRPTFVILNEIQWWQASNDGLAMYSVIEGNITKSRLGAARYLAICNAHVPGQDSVGERMWSAYLGVQSGTAYDTGLLYDSIEAPADTPVSEIPNFEEDPEGFAKGLEMLRAGLKVARGDAHWLDVETIILSVLDENNAVSESRRKYLNQVNAAEDAWMTTEWWDRALKLEDNKIMPGDTITLGFDGSKSGDHTALVACRVSDGLLNVLKVWDPENYPTKEIPREQVNAAVHHAFGRYDVVAFRADVKEFESYVDDWTKKYKRKMKVNASPGNPIAFDMRGQTKRFAFDCEKFLDGVRTGDVWHDGNKLLARHVLNACLNPTSYDAISIRKESKDSSRKIDAAVCAVLAYAARQEFLMSKRSRTGGVVILS